MPRILIVDDEEHIVILASAALNRAGFETVGATSGKMALELGSETVDILLTDCVMPDLFGDQLAARLKERNPSLKVIFMSGNPVGSLELGCPLEENVNFLQKPFEFESLVSIVQNAFGSGPLPNAQNADEISAAPDPHHRA